jgi:hypothetical protein
MHFVRERLTVNFIDPIKKLNLKTFPKIAKTVKVASKSKKTKQTTAERNVFSQLVMIAIKQKSASISTWSCPMVSRNLDGTPAETDKSKLMHCLKSESHLSEKPAADIIDGIAMFQSQVVLTSTSGEVADSLFAQLPNVSRVDYVTDSCFQNSIKSIETNRRGTSATHLIKESATKVPRD